MSKDKLHPYSSLSKKEKEKRKRVASKWQKTHKSQYNAYHKIYEQKLRKQKKVLEGEIFDKIWTEVTNETQNK